MNDALRATYDELPYESHAFPQTHPDRLCVIARLFGMRPHALEGCRVLELGCGNGANLIPMAAAMPDSTFRGIDLSPRQIEMGKQRIADLKLTNIELTAADMNEIKHDLPVFDFIIAHGVFSWVPPEVQDAILEICGRKLSADGIAYVSYNTYPGWRMRGTIRDFMLYHVRQFKEPKVQAQQARALLDFMAKSAPGENSPYSIQLRNEVEELRKLPDAYIFHDHLEPYNAPVYFHQFVEIANRHGLQYLGETELATMLPSNFPGDTAETLKRIAPDLVRSEQFMDFLRNRQFRQTLLVHADVPLSRAIDWRALESLELGSPAQPVSPPVDERSNAKVEFRSPLGISLSTSTPITKAAFMLMGLRWPRTTPFADLCAGARSRLGTLPTAAPDPAIVAQDSMTLGTELLQCAGAGMVELRSRPALFTLTVPDRPHAWDVARVEARDGVHVANLRHETVTLDEFNRQLLLRLDGTRSHAMLVEEMAKLVESNQLAIQQEGVEVRDPASVREIMARAVQQNLVSLARVAMFPA